jgi:hypothetical protein
MSGHSTAAFGIYADENTAKDAVGVLKAAGFRVADISVLLQANAGTKDLAHRKSSKAPEGATVGGGAGALIGAACGWLAGAGSFAIPGLEPFAAAGPILGSMSGTGIGVMLGAITGGIMGAGMPEYEAKRYMGRVRNGGVLMSVHCDDSVWESSATKILKQTGATHISTMSEARADYARTAKPMPRTKASDVS